jgi:GNAT superfamily N-acetyltransferase
VSDPDFAFALREGRPDDHAFVAESWLQSDKHSPSGRDDGPGYMARAKVRIRRILGRSELRVLCSKEDSDAILAWAVVGHLAGVRPGPDPLRPAVYYVYVRTELRRQGLARLLLSDLKDRDVTYTHRPVVRGLTPPAGWVYDRAPNYEGS